jgi:hypothetical protein
MPKVVSLDAVRTRLAVIWLVGAALVLIIVVLQSLLGHYDDKVQEVWGWLLPTLMPTLGMIITVLGYTALDPKALESVVRISFLQVSVWLSALYLFLVALTILIQPFVAADAERAVQMMRQSNLWLGPVQGLVASALGVLFVSKKDAHPPVAPTPGG